MPDDVSRLSYPVPRTDPAEFPPEYVKLREEAPVCPVTLATGDPAWLVTRHEDVKTVLADRRFSRAAMCGEDASRYQVVRPFPDSILNMDPPRHTRIRKLVNRAFTAARVEQLRPRIQQVVDELLDGMAAVPGPVDLNVAFGRPLPLRIVCEMLGVPFSDHPTFLRWTNRIMALKGFTAEETIETYLEMRNYFVQLLASKRREPGDDLISALISLSDEEGKLTEAELISLGTFLLVSGHDTSVTVLADATLTLLDNRDQVDELLADPALWPNAVEELLRLNNPGGSIFPRIATTDVTIADTVIGKGDAVVAHIGSGCRDGNVVADPERFDIHREVGFQIFFGHGPHFCLGAALARAEMEIGLRGLFERFPKLALAMPRHELRWKDFNALGGFEKFPITMA